MAAAAASAAAAAAARLASERDGSSNSDAGGKASRGGTNKKAGGSPAKTGSTANQVVSSSGGSKTGKSAAAVAAAASKAAVAGIGVMLSGVSFSQALGGAKGDRMWDRSHQGDKLELAKELKSQSLTTSKTGSAAVSVAPSAPSCSSLSTISAQGKALHVSFAAGGQAASGSAPPSTNSSASGMNELKRSLATVPELPLAGPHSDAVAISSTSSSNSSSLSGISTIAPAAQQGNKDALSDHAAAGSGAFGTTAGAAAVTPVGLTPAMNAAVLSSAPGALQAALLTAPAATWETRRDGGPPLKALDKEFSRSNSSSGPSTDAKRVRRTLSLGSLFAPGSGAEAAGEEAEIRPALHAGTIGAAADGAMAPADKVADSEQEGSIQPSPPGPVTRSLSLPSPPLPAAAELAEAAEELASGPLHSHTSQPSLGKSTSSSALSNKNQQQQKQVAGLGQVVQRGSRLVSCESFAVLVSMMQEMLAAAAYQEDFRVAHAVLSLSASISTQPGMHGG